MIGSPEMAKRKETRFKQQLYFLQRKYDEQGGGDHFDEILADAEHDPEFLAFLIKLKKAKKPTP
jgi:hypothetical protein